MLSRHLLSNKEIINFNMFGSSMEHRIQRDTAGGCTTPSSLSRVCIHMISAVTLAMTLYFASVLEWDTIGCFLALQKTKFEPSNTAKPPMDQRSSTHPAQSASENPLTNIEEDRVICNPRSAVPCTYRRTRLAGVGCSMVRACKNWQILFTKKLISGQVNVRYCSPLLCFDSLLHQSVQEDLQYMPIIFPT
jgi:hypothetical protein